MPLPGRAPRFRRRRPAPDGEAGSERQRSLSASTPGITRGQTTAHTRSPHQSELATQDYSRGSLLCAVERPGAAAGSCLLDVGTLSLTDRCTRLLGILRRILGKPFRDRRHIRLEIARDREVQDARSTCTSILEIMRHSTWCQYEGALGSIDPAIANQKAHPSFNHIENVVFRVRVRTGALSVWLQPPLGDRIPSLCFVAVCLEDSAYASHRVRTSLTRRQNDADSSCRAILNAHAPSS